MFNLERSGLSQKLTMMSVLSTGGALLLVFIAFAITSVLSHSEDARQQLSSLAGVIGNSSRAALRSGDRQQAAQMLSPLALEQDILQAALYDQDGQLLARYAAPALPPEQAAPQALDLSAAMPDMHSERSGQPWSPAMRVYRTLRSQETVAGFVMVESSQARMWLDVLKNLGAAAVAAMLSFMMALLTAARFKGSIAEPVGKLIAAAQQVSRGQPAQRIAGIVQIFLGLGLVQVEEKSQLSAVEIVYQRGDIDIPGGRGVDAGDIGTLATGVAGHQIVYGAAA